MGRHLITATVRDKRGRVLSVATNQYGKSHPLQRHFAMLCGEDERVYLHAELSALLRCRDKIPYSIHVERYTKDGHPALAAPCPICRKALAAFGVKHITYTGKL